MTMHKTARLHDFTAFERVQTLQTAIHLIFLECLSERARSLVTTLPYSMLLYSRVLLYTNYIINGFLHAKTK